MRKISLPKKFATALALSTFLLPVGLPGGITLASDKVTSSKQKEALPPATQIAAEINGLKPITMGDLFKEKESLPKRYSSIPFEKMYGLLLAKKINAILLEKGASDKNIDKSPEFQEKMVELNATFTEKYYLENLIKASIEKEKLKELYHKLTNLLKKDKEIRIRHILFKTKNEANRALKEIQSGQKNFKDFLPLSLDKESAEKEGIIDNWFLLSQFEEKYRTLFQNAKKGDALNQPFAFNEMGYSVVIFDESREITPPSFEEMEDELRAQLYPEHMNKISEKLIKEADSQVYDLKGKLISEKEKSSIDFKDIDFGKISDSLVIAKSKNGEQVTVSELKALLKGLSSEQMRDVCAKRYFQVIDFLTLKKIISKRAKEERIEQKPDYQEKKNQEIERLKVEIFKKQEALKAITPEILQQRYEEIIKKIPDEEEIRLRHIAVKDKETANKIIKEFLSSGGSAKKFDEWAQKYSLDKKTKDKNGDLGYIQFSYLRKKTADTLSKKAKATLLSKPIKTKYIVPGSDKNPELKNCYSVVRIEDKKIAPKPSFQELQGLILKSLFKKESENVLENLRKQYKLRIYDIKGKTIVDDSKAIEAKAPQQPPQQ